MPMITVSCPHCRSTLQLDASQTPELGDCPRCNRSLLAPAATLTDPVWYFIQHRQKFGPVTLVELQQFAANKQLRPGDLVLNRLDSEWVRADSVEGLFPKSK